MQAQLEMIRFPFQFQYKMLSHEFFIQMREGNKSIEYPISGRWRPTMLEEPRSNLLSISVVDYGGDNQDPSENAQNEYRYKCCFEWVFRTQIAPFQNESVVCTACDIFMIDNSTLVDQEEIMQITIALPRIPAQT